MVKQLVVNADDFGRTPGIVQGILQAHREGIVTSTTAMMNMPDIGDSLRLARQEPNLGLGVHLVFTAGKPLLSSEQVPSLVDPDGMFWKVDAWQSRLDRLNLEELWDEWRAQVALFRKWAGEPDHLDCHHFIHVYPPIFERYLNLARDEGLPARVPFDSESAADDGATAFGASFGISAEVVEAILAADRDLLKARPVPHPSHFFGGFFGDDNVTTERLLAILAAVPDGVSELMVHPGLADELLLSSSSYSWQREREKEILCDPAIIAQVEQLGIVLANFGIWG